jgi:hypothetical protein
MQRMQRRLFTEYKGEGAFHFQPMGEIIGPMYLQNERAIFDLNVRVLSDQAPDPEPSGAGPGPGPGAGPGPGGG